MDTLLTFENLLTALGALAVGALWAYRTLSKHSAELKAQRIGQIHAFTSFAYGAVSELARHTQTKVDDKIAKALEVINAQLVASGAKPLEEAEVALVKPVLDTLHVEEKKAAASPQ